MKLVRREFLQLAGAVITVSEASHSARAQTPTGGPSPTQILRNDLLGQDYKVTETLVTTVAFPPGAISSWHVHPGAQELVFGLEGKLTLEIDTGGQKHRRRRNRPRPGHECEKCHNMDTFKQATRGR